MIARRALLAGLAATAALPGRGWADAGGPAFLAAARTPEGEHLLCGLTSDGSERFRLPLPGRGHAAAAHPQRGEAVAFARHPGRFAVVIDCVTGRRLARLDAPEGRHFYGHGAFLAGGALLATSENLYDAGLGVIGLWDTQDGYRRIGEVASGGTGPHEILALPGDDRLLVANGGIRTHPDSGGDRLNLATMLPNLAVVSPQDGPQEVMTLAPELHHASIRHLALRPDGLAGFAMQWQGDTVSGAPLLGLWKPGEAPRLLGAPGLRQLAMQGHAGAIAFNPSGSHVAISSPRGGEVQIFDAASGTLDSHWQRPGICGLAPRGAGFLASDEAGGLFALTPGTPATPLARHPTAWDSHILPLAPA